MVNWAVANGAKEVLTESQTTMALCEVVEKLISQRDSEVHGNYRNIDPEKDIKAYDNELMEILHRNLT